MAKPANLRIEDVAAATARADLNDILISIASLQTTDGAGTGYTGEPTTTYPNMLWYDKTTDILKMRSEADDAWITVGNLNQAANTFAAAVALASQAEAEAGTENTKTMTALRTKQAIDALAGPTLGTAQASTSGTNIDFTGIPAGAKRVTVIFVGTSLSGSSSIVVQLGTSGGFVTTGYEGGSYVFVGGSNAAVAPTNGLPVCLGATARNISGTMTLNLATGNTWVASVSGGASAGFTSFAGGGNIALGGTLTQLRITTINGTDTFDAGTVNIMWE